MSTIFSILALLLDVAFMILLVHVIMSWLINFQVLNLR
ncbi:MAG: YggT family protein, partial [Pseudomonadota bacterium]